MTNTILFLIFFTNLVAISMGYLKYLPRDDSSNYLHDDNMDFSFIEDSNRPVKYVNEKQVNEDISKLADLNDMSNDDLEKALSHLSVAELDTLDKYIDSNPLSSPLRKREIQPDQDDETSEEASQRWDCPKNGANAREDPAELRLNNEQRKTDNRYEKRAALTPNLPFRRTRAQRLTPDQRIEAKINFMRDKFKRQSAMEKLEKSVQKRQDKRDISERMPYYRSLIGPRSRTKRESVYTRRQNTTLQDEPQQGDSYLKMLDDSFPNPEQSIDDTMDLHVRVKRNTSTSE